MTMCPAVLPGIWQLPLAGFQESFRRSRYMAPERDLAAIVRATWNYQHGISNGSLLGLASLLQAMFALEGMMNWSRNEASGSAASREAAYSLLAALSGNDGLEQLFSDMAEEFEPKQPCMSSSLSNCTMPTGSQGPSRFL